MATQKAVFTTGQVAKICKVAPRTVSKWFDGGRLKGYRIPGSQDRRVPRDQLVRFLKEHGMPLGDLDDEAGAVSVLVVGSPAVAAGLTAAGVSAADLADGLSLGLWLGDHPHARPAAVVMGGWLGRDLAASLLAGVARWSGPLVWLLGEDGGDPPPGCVGVPWPHDPAEVRRACGLGGA